jgi:hypothetical protein
LQQLIVKLQSELATDLRTGASSPAAKALRDVAQSHGFDLQPLHSGIHDGELAKFFSGKLAEQQTGSAIVSQLRTVPGVEAAYIKPLATPP